MMRAQRSFSPSIISAARRILAARSANDVRRCARNASNAVWILASTSALESGSKVRTVSPLAGLIGAIAIHIGFDTIGGKNQHWVMKKFGLVLLLAASACAQTDISGERMRAHVKFLASDLLEGRGVGTRGGELATEYIAAQFALVGAGPAGENGTYFQRGPRVGAGGQRSTAQRNSRSLGPGPPVRTAPTSSACPWWAPPRLPTRPLVP